MKVILTIQIIVALIVISLVIFGAAKCTSYLTSGEIGRDLGEFAGEIEQGYKEASENGKPLRGITPAIALVNPKFPHNVGAVIRAASCFGAEQVWFSGNRVSLTATENYRLPREERMKGYKHVSLTNEDYFFDRFDNDVVPVAIEVRENSENLVHFKHPEKALYVFGPEDGSISRMHLRHCQRFVFVPTAHCLNLAAAVNLVLYDRRMKEIQSGKDNRYTLSDFLNEERGFIANS